MTHYKIEKTIEIDASVQKVWDGLTNPEIIKQYMFGTETICDWKEGSEIIFQGNYEGTTYKDKGIIQKIIAETILQYTYLSSFSGLEDKPENYHLITYELQEQDNKTNLKLKQENIQSKEAQDHADKNWDFVLLKMKEVLEQ
ncbi:MAG: SRPBCC domain-containing protein [Bacteroidales bacterium]|nr:SRPBCC domain-containing protein [Bacteroidales bacterium]